MNPNHSSIPFLYPLKTENQSFIQILQISRKSSKYGPFLQCWWPHQGTVDSNWKFRINFRCHLGLSSFMFVGIRSLLHVLFNNFNFILTICLEFFTCQFNGVIWCVSQLDFTFYVFNICDDLDRGKRRSSLYQN